MDERNVGRAAKRVGLSQPAFSNAIARLRARIGDSLFVRTAQGMIPTSRADRLAGPIRSALAQLRQTFEEPYSFDPSVSSQRFRVGLSDDVELRLVPLFARAMLSGELQMQTRRLDWLSLCLRRNFVTERLILRSAISPTLAILRRVS